MHIPGIELYTNIKQANANKDDSYEIVEHVYNPRRDDIMKQQ